MKSSKMCLKTRPYLPNAAAFTLVELMVIVFIIMILASIAAPNLIRYMRKGRTVEAVEALDKIAAGARIYHASTYRLPESSGGYFPSETHADACAANYGVFLRTSLGEFDQDPWKTLLFSHNNNIRYRYMWTQVLSTPSGAEGIGNALGDTDCDGDMSTWQVWMLRTTRDGPLEKRGPALLLGTDTE